MNGVFSKYEQLCKRCLKRTVSINKSNLVKILIAGTLSLGIAACGGGGGGSSSVSPPTGGEATPKPPEDNTPPGIKLPLVFNGGTHSLEGEFNISEEGITAVKGINANITNLANIYSSGTGSVVISSEENNNGQLNKNIQNYIENNGNISIVGQNKIGILGKTATNSSSSIVNNGTVLVDGNDSIGIKSENGVNAKNIGTIKIQNNGFGLINDGENSLAENKGTILGENIAIGSGMVAMNGGIAINSGEIIINSKSNSLDVNSGVKLENGKFTNENSGTISLKGVGNAIHGSGMVENKGTISVESEMGNSNGIKLTSGEAINDGIINVVSDNGIAIKNESGNIINNGTISIVGKEAIGMESNGTTINSGIISSSGRHSNGIFGDTATLINEETGKIYVSDEYSIGMKAVNESKIENKGLIEAEGIGVAGIYVDENDYSEIINGETGKIFTNGSSSSGIANYRGNSNIINSGLISGKGIYATGIHGVMGTILNEETGGINISGEYSNGIRTVGTSNIDNRGLIQVDGNGVNGIYPNNNANYHKLGNRKNINKWPKW